MERTTVVMGIGNPLLQDDRAGLAVVERLREAGVRAEFEEMYTVGFEVLDKLMGHDRAFVIDACVLGGAPGAVHDVSVSDIFTTAALLGSHAITLGTTLKIGYDLFPDDMPRELRIFLIEAACPTEFSTTCTPAVEEAITATAERIAALL